MKPIIRLILALTSTHGLADTNRQVAFLRQEQRETGVVWDLPIAHGGSLELAPDTLGSLFQLWSVEASGSEAYLLDQRMIGDYLPTAGIRIITLDPDSSIPRTRVDQPFSVEIRMTGLLTGFGLPDPFTRVRLDHHICATTTAGHETTAATIRADVPLDSGLITNNGSTVLKFPAASIQAQDPTTARGEEHFVIRSLPDGSLAPTQLASAFVQVWPIASGSIHGIAPDQEITGKFPDLELNLTDLYPRSDTYLMIFPGRAVNGVDGIVITAFPMHRERAESITLEVAQLGQRIPANGTYTAALISETVYGRELLCSPVTFSVNRRAPALQATR